MIKKKDLYKNKILEIAVANRDYKLVKFVIEECNVNLLYENSTVLSTAVKNNDLKMVKYLLKSGIDINEENGVALDIAIENNYLNILAIFIEYQKMELN